MEFEAILFDVGDTLLHVPEDPHKRALESVSHLGAVPFEHYRATIDRVYQEWREAGGLPEHEDLTETWVAHSKRALELVGFQGDSAAAAELIEHAFLKEGWELFPDVIATLAQLKDKGMRMGVVSNWPPTLDSTLEAAGIKQYFEVIAASGVVGYPKPHPAIFNVALSQMGVEPGSALFIGDKLSLDIEGAAAVGMPSVLIDRQGRFPEHQERVSSLQELLAYVA